MEDTKYCPKCHLRRPKSEFYKASNTSDGLGGYCKNCVRRTARQYLLAHPEKVALYRRNAQGKYSEQRKAYGAAYRRRPEVRERERARQRSDASRRSAHERYLRNREARKEYSRRYYAEHKAHCADVGRKYRENNQQTIRRRKNDYARTSPVAKAQRLAYRKRRLQNDSAFALRERARKLVHDSFMRRGYAKDSRARRIIGCDWGTLCRHLFRTWQDRYGEIYSGEPYHIDHIVPLSTAETEEDVARLCHYTNLQLLKPEDNLAKAAKTDWEG